MAYSWNRLHEFLGEVFALLKRQERWEALVFWHSIKSDRDQRRCLEAVAKSLTECPSPFDLRAEILWLVAEADALADERNDAVHAPATLYVGHDAEKVEMGAKFFTGHPRAEKLKGKNLVVEFRRCEEWSDALQEYAKAIIGAWSFPQQLGMPRRPNREPRVA